jgi:hypothetical protein
MHHRKESTDYPRMLFGALSSRIVSNSGRAIESKASRKKRTTALFGSESRLSQNPFGTGRALLVLV